MAIVRGSFSATGASSTVEGTDAEVIVSGTFTGTVTLQMAISSTSGTDVWVSVGTALTASGTIQYNGLTTRKFRANYTHTSGSLIFELVAVRDRGLMEAA